MIRFRIMDVNWALMCKRTSISNLMELLQDDTIADVEVVSEPNSVADHNGTAYLTITCVDGSVTFLRMRMDCWEMVYHMINASPFNCVCRMCEWRKQRKRYVDLTAYKHLTRLSS